MIFGPRVNIFDILVCDGNAYAPAKYKIPATIFSGRRALVFFFKIRNGVSKQNAETRAVPDTRIRLNDSQSENQPVNFDPCVGVWRL